MRTLLTLVLLLLSLAAGAQNTMRIHYAGGTSMDVALNQIDSITLVNIDSSEPQPQEATLIGSWLWAKDDAGYYELLTFSSDRTFTGLSTYYEYGFATPNYGSYSLRGSMLTLLSYGYGYQRVLRWFVIGLTANALDVMTQMGSFTYYRLQPETISLAAGSSLDPSASTSATFTDGGTFVFADGATVSLVNGSLHALAPGTTYVQYRRADGNIVAYKVVVS